MDPKEAQRVRSIAQNQLRHVVNRELTLSLKGRGPQSRVEEAFVRAIYNPDRRLG